MAEPHAAYPAVNGAPVNKTEAVPGFDFSYEILPADIAFEGNEEITGAGNLFGREGCYKPGARLIGQEIRSDELGFSMGIQRGADVLYGRAENAVEIVMVIGGYLTAVGQGAGTAETARSCRVPEDW